MPRTRHYPQPHETLLLTDLYQLTMLQGYFDQGMEEEAVFEFFVRKLPETRNFLMAAGLEQVLDLLENGVFSEDELAWLEGTGRFRADFLDYLKELRFRGSVHALPEGSLYFADEPILRVTAPLPQAQLFESRIINLLHFQTLIASKAARCVLAAPGRLLVDFGLRRAHGAEAGLLAARAAFLAGFAGSSTVLAGMRYGLPIYGTVAHSFIQAHDDELTAFEHYALAQPTNVVLLIDTYDTEAGAKKAVAAASRLRERGIEVRALRLDSGDLARHAEQVRTILDEAGFPDIRIFSSGDLDEHRLQELLSSGAPIDGFGVGTRLDTSADAPYLDCAYKLMEYAGRPRRKRSEGKATWPGRKQVVRRYDEAGRPVEDLVCLEEEAPPGEPLLQCVMRQGERLSAAPPLTALRQHAERQLARLPEALRSLDPAPLYRVTISPGVQRLREQLDRQTGAER